MTIGIIVSAQLISSVGIVEPAGVYNSSMRVFNYGQELINKAGDTRVWKRAGDAITIPNYDENKNDYKMFDLVWKDGKTQYVNNTSGVEIKQPEDYDNVDTSLNPADWQYRYMNFGELKDRNDGLNSYKFHAKIVEVVADYFTLFLLRYTNNNETDMIFINGELVKDTTQYGDADNYVDVSDATFHWNSDGEARSCIGLVANTTLNEGDKFYIPCTYAKTGTLLIHKDYGYVLEVGEQIDDDKYKYYVYVIRDDNNSTKNYYYQDGDNYKKVFAITNGDELEATILNEYRQLWYPRVVIVRDGHYYIRTNVNANIEYKDVTSFTFKELESIDEIGWDWVDYRPTQEYAPFDNKKYTYLESNIDISYTIKSNGDFDMLALNGLIASSIKVNIYNENDEIIESKTAYPKCESELQGKTWTTEGIAFIYLDNRYDKGTKVEISIIPKDGYLRLGGGYLGDRVITGKTNLEFSNDFKSFGYFEQDKFGNIYNSDGVKIRVLSGTVDFKIERYDDVSPILKKVIMGEKIIIDGSDNLQNKETDSKSYFLSTMMVGRMRSLKQKTSTKNGRLSSLATYSFNAEEDV